MDAVIIAAGLCCPLGETFEASAVAYGAGERALRREPSLVGIDGRPPTLAWVMAAGEERNYGNRLLRLFESAFSDCLSRSTSLLTGGLKRIGLVLILPRWLNGHPIAKRLSEVLRAHPYDRFSDLRLCFGAQAETLWMVQGAAQEIAGGSADAMFVAALDSHIDTVLLDHLAAENEILTSTQPHGIVPSEACAVIALAQRSFRLENSAEIAGFGVGMEDKNDDRPVGIRGLGLGEALRGAAAGLGRKTAARRVLTDLNGQRWRAEHYGVGLANFGDGLGSALLNPECYALAMGDVGAAAGGVMIALALGAAPRGRDDPPDCEALKYPTLIVATSRRGRSCALALLHAQGTAA